MSDIAIQAQYKTRP